MDYKIHLFWNIILDTLPLKAKFMLPVKTENISSRIICFSKKSQKDDVHLFIILLRLNAAAASIELILSPSNEELMVNSFQTIIERIVFAGKQITTSPSFH